MRGLGRNVYWLCQKDHMDGLHFDATQLNFINYGDAAEARKRLYNRIMAIEGPGKPVRT